MIGGWEGSRGKGVEQRRGGRGGGCVDGIPRWNRMRLIVEDCVCLWLLNERL